MINYARKIFLKQAQRKRWSFIRDVFYVTHY